MNQRLKIEISLHAREQMEERGVLEDEVNAAIRLGETEPARKGRIMYKKNFNYNKEWRGKHYSIKQVAPIVIQEPDKLIVVTVYAFYF